MRCALVISLLGLVGCTPTPPPPIDDCLCPDGFVCCPGTQICVVPGSGSGCSTPSSPDMAWPTPDFATGNDLAPAADLAPPTIDMPTSPRFTFNPSMLTFATTLVANHDVAEMTVYISNPDRAVIQGFQLATGVGGDQLLIVNDTCTGGNGDCYVTVRFSPTYPGPLSSALTVVVASLPVATCPITGGATAGVAQLSADPTTLDFGDVHVKTPGAALAVTVRNDGTAATTNLVTGFDPLDAPFVFDSRVFHADSCGSVLGAGSSCKLYFVFYPQQESSVSAKITVHDGTIAAPVVTLTGRGVDPAALQVKASGAFTDQWLGTHSDDVTFHVSNGGGDPTGVLATSISGDNMGDFKITSDGCLGQTLAGQGNCDIKVQFAPLARGSRNAMLNVGDTSGGNVATPLQGVAFQPATLTLTDGNGTTTTAFPGSKWLSFSLRNDGDAATEPLVLTFGGTSNGVFGLATGGSCQGAVLNAGATCYFDALFAPPYQGHWTDSVTVSSPNSAIAVTPLAIPLDGTFASTETLHATPTAIRFGTVNTTVSSQVTIVNTTPQPIGPLTLATSGNSNFSILDGSECANQTLAAGKSCGIKVQYTPTFTGSFKGTLTVSADSGSVSVALFASSLLPAFKFDPAKADFGTVAIGVVPPITVTVTNVSNRPAPTTFVVSDANFWVTSNCPATLLPAPATNSCTISVGFGPRAAGLFNGTVKFTAADATPILALTGIAQ